jgi:opacity protein-like surface antigen
MKRLISLAAALAIVATSASAQNQNPPANPGPGNNAINSTGANNPGAPVQGRNSFTEGQAKSRIESNGFSNVSNLKKDDSGVWRGKATKEGKSVDVSLDFQGNIVAK